MKTVYNFVLALSVGAGLLVSSLFVPDARALGLEVDPVEINLKNVPLGRKIAVSALGGEKAKLRIQNKAPVAYTYTITVLPVSKTSSALKKGYINIPDTSWLRPQKREVLIPGNSLKEVELFLKIPRRKKYKNKDFQAVIEVKSKKNRPEEVFVVAVQLRMFFSTHPAVEKVQSDKSPQSLTKRKRTPHTLEVFSMSQCPFSAAALEKLITAQKQGRLHPELKLDCHYIATPVKPCKPCGEAANELKFSSLHGQAEVEEDIRQLCIKKYAPEGFFDYLLLRNKDIKDTDWEAPAERAGVDIEAIKKCALNREGKTLLKEDIKRAKELNIIASPVFLYENNRLIRDFNLLKELPGLENLEVITAEPEDKE